jgi:hypothetical protein
MVDRALALRAARAEGAAVRSDLVDLLLCLHVETARAILVSDDGDRTKAVWLPLSQCEVERKPKLGHDIVEVTCPEWLAVDKGLL